MQIFHYSIYPDVKEIFIEKYPQFFGDDVDSENINQFIKRNTPPYLVEMQQMNRRWNIY